MWGTEWNITGNLKDWDVTARLGELDMPVLITSGRHDLTTPAVVRPIADGTRGAGWVVFSTARTCPRSRSRNASARSSGPSSAKWKQLTQGPSAMRVTGVEIGNDDLCVLAADRTASV